jgi:hypothetical protein
MGRVCIKPRSSVLKNIKDNRSALGLKNSELVQNGNRLRPGFASDRLNDCACRGFQSRHWSALVLWFWDQSSAPPLL